MLIAMATWDTEENGRTGLTRRTLESLAQTVDWGRHRLVISDNGSCEATHEVYSEMAGRLPFEVLFNGRNIGTANAINRVWRERGDGEHAVKMDNDVIVKQAGWADLLVEVFERAGDIGICGLKRVDLEEQPDHRSPWYRSTLRMLPHVRGQRWIVVEEVNHVMGTCQAYSAECLDKIGYLEQVGGVYGFDDSLASLRARVSGFKVAFVPYVEIEHIDPGGTAYTVWKAEYAGKMMRAYQQRVTEYHNGLRAPYYDGGDFGEGIGDE